MADKITKIQKDIKDTLKILKAELEKTKKTKDSNAMEDFISGIYEKAKTFEISTIQKFIFLFVEYYNEISSKFENPYLFILKISLIFFTISLVDSLKTTSPKKSKGLLINFT